MVTGYQYQLTDDSSPPEHLVGPFGFGEGESLSDERLDLPALEEVEQGGQVLAKESRADTFEPLYAIGHQSLTAGEHPAAEDIEREQTQSVEAIPAA